MPLRVTVALTLILIVFANQEPQTSPPVSHEDLYKAIEALQQEINGARAELKAYRMEQAQKNLKAAETRAAREAREARAAKRNRAAEQEVRLARRRLKSERRETYYETTELQLATEARLARTEKLLPVPPARESRMVMAQAVEINQLQQKIARANRRWHCKFLRIGCIGRK
jgi:hypothetical protein